MAPRIKKLNTSQAEALADSFLPAPGAQSAPPIETAESDLAFEDVELAGAVEEAAMSTIGHTSTIERGAWGGVIETIITIDVQAEFDELTELLSLGNGVTDYGVILSALDASSTNAFRATRLARAAKLEELKVDREVSEHLEVLRTSASKALNQEKVDGTRSKAPTIQDIEDRMMANWPGQVHTQRRKSEEMHAVRGLCESLEARWAARLFSLKSMADRYAPTRIGA